MNPATQSTSIEVLDRCQFYLTTYSNIAEIKTALSKVQVIGSVQEVIGTKPPLHLICTEPAGKAIVIEFVKKEVQIYDAPLGCFTNAPSYVWHITNLRNYVNLSATAIPQKKIDDLDFAPLGGGSGMIGLPGDFTPPSRFIRAVAFTQTARKTDTGKETIYEAFRILDNFNVPLGSAEGEGANQTQGMRGSTYWTTAYDTKNRVMYYYTMHNRRVRMVDLKAINFSKRHAVDSSPVGSKKGTRHRGCTPQNRRDMLPFDHPDKLISNHRDCMRFWHLNR